VDCGIVTLFEFADACMDPVCVLSAVAAATLPDTQGKNKFNEASTREIHLAFANVPSYVKTAASLT
jgi:hypothetical protein